MSQHPYYPPQQQQYPPNAPVTGGGYYSNSNVMGVQYPPHQATLVNPYPNTQQQQVVGVYLPPLPTGPPVQAPQGYTVTAQGGCSIQSPQPTAYQHVTSIPPASTLPTTQVEIRVSCKNLPNLDVLSKSDPQVILFSQKKGLVNGREQLVWQMLGRTESIKNNLNPQFTTSFKLEYFFEQVQKLCFVVVDVDSQNRPELHYQDYIGCVQIQLGQLVSSGKNRGFESKLSAELPSELSRLVKPGGGRPTHMSTMTIIADELSSCKQTMQLILCAKNLEKKDTGLFGGSSDPFFEIQRAREDPLNPFITVFKSEYITKNLNPVWKEVGLQMAEINQGSMVNPFKIRVFDWDKDGTHDFIGEVFVTINDLINSMNEKRGLPLINPITAQKKGSKYQNSGLLFVQKCFVQQQVSFLDYIASGTEISLSIGIDFTGSNGNPRDPRSLHFMAPPTQKQQPNGTVVVESVPNQYQVAMSSVGSVLEAYDTDKRFPVYGFGLRINQTNQVYHAYPINGNFAHPEIVSISGVLEWYRQFLGSGMFELYGPTNFSPLIIETCQRIRNELTVATNNGQQPLERIGLGKYHILLIMTDGLITDMDATVESIVDASTLPLSIVIVGVGNEDFSAMNFLDGDGKTLRDRHGRSAERDCVQFVAMNRFSPTDQLEALAKETLAEIPRQFLAWTSIRRVQPRQIPN